MTETLATSGSVKLKAGADVSTAITTEQYTEMINQAEGNIVADTRVNWLDVYSTMDADYKEILQGAVSAKAAISAINYNLGVYPSLNHATTMINVNLDEYDRAVAKLKDANIFKPFGGTAIAE